MDGGGMVTLDDALSSFLKFADSVRENYERPAWSEVCVCGASVEVGRCVPNAERARIFRQWVARHSHCMRVVDLLPEWVRP